MLKNDYISFRISKRIKREQPATMSRHAQREASVGVGKNVLLPSAGGWVAYLQRGTGLTQIQQVADVPHLEDLIALQRSWAARRRSTNAQFR
jgi:hypothetical protein